MDKHQSFKEIRQQKSLSTRSYGCLVLLPMIRLSETQVTETEESIHGPHQRILILLSWDLCALDIINTKCMVHLFLSFEEVAGNVFAVFQYLS